MTDVLTFKSYSFSGTVVVTRSGTGVGAVTADLHIAGRSFNPKHPKYYAGKISSGVEVAKNALYPLAWADGEIGDKAIVIPVTANQLNPGIKSATISIRDPVGAAVATPHTAIFIVEDGGSIAITSGGTPSPSGIVQDTNRKDYFIPADATQAMQDFLGALSGGGEVYAMGYLWTNTTMLNALLSHFQAGHAVHILADCSQKNISGGYLQPLHNAGVEVIFGSSPIRDSGSAVGRYIMHTKSIVIAGTGGNPHYVFTGSANFTYSGMSSEVNTISSFYSDSWAQSFVRQWNAIKADALANLGSYQF